MTSRDIPDQPEGNYRFMAIVTLDGYGRPRQLEKEFRQTLERLLHNELGKQACLTSLTRTTHHKSNDPEVVITDSTIGDSDEDPSGIY